MKAPSSGFIIASDNNLLLLNCQGQKTKTWISLFEDCGVETVIIEVNDDFLFAVFHWQQARTADSA